MNILNFFGVSSYTWKIDLNLGERKKTEVVCCGEILPDLEIFTNEESIQGTVTISHYSATSLEHEGIYVYLIGETEQCSLEANEQWEFQNEPFILAPPGILNGSSHTFPFCFDQDIEIAHESYYGLFATLRYFLKVVIKRKFAVNIQMRREIFAMKYSEPPFQKNALIKLEGGVKDCLHIHYNFPRRIYHLNDVITGTIFFELIRVSIAKIELCLIRKERTGRIPSSVAVVSSYEILDGPPVKGETVPIRMFLGSLPITPTYQDAEGVDVIYYLQTTIIDEQNLKYEYRSRVHIFRDRAPPVPPKFLMLEFNPYPTDRPKYTDTDSEETTNSDDESSGDIRGILPSSNT